jgi:hypothetical protein
MISWAENTAGFIANGFKMLAREENDTSEVLGTQVRGWKIITNRKMLSANHRCRHLS